jgi:phosphoenolpyruvate carboxylase
MQCSIDRRGGASGPAARQGEVEMAGTKSARDKSGDRIALRGQAPAQRALPKSARARRLRDELPVEACVFPQGGVLEIGALERDLGQVLGVLGDLRERNPFGNSIKLLALELGKRLDREALGYADLERLIQQLTAQGYGHRADRLAAYLGERDEAKNVAAIRAAIRKVALPEGQNGRKAAPIPFAEFQALLERELFGIVITAHPTFSQSTEMLRSMAELAMERDSAGNKLGAKERERRLSAARGVEHRPPVDLALSYEHRLSIEAIGNIQMALRRVYDIVFEVAAELYPKDWESLRPKLLTIASWVGYDLDGRSDIKWSDTLFKRLRVQTAQLEQYLSVIEELRAQRSRGEAHVDLAHLLDLLESRLALAIKEANDEIEVFQSGDADPKTWNEEVRRIAKRMHDGRHLRLIDSAQLLELIERALQLSKRPADRRKLLILRAELCNHGLGMAHTHVRLNAVQIHNAIRKLIDMETEPDDPARKRSYLAAAGKLLREVKPVRINFASILAERTSAKRLFMIVAQMLKYIDATTPVRFLIAESESPLTLLAALYFAKLFGVEAKVDISPLFETTKAFERGIRVIDECLQNPDFAAYVRQRGRLCIQTGFSDAGRQLGQIVAAISVEWLRLKLADLLRERGFADIELVVFDTHGEAIGRGGHPESFVARLEYVASPASRRKFQDNGIRAKEEVSFQGGDGYALFITPQIAFASVARIVEYILDKPGEELLADPAYGVEEDYIKEFFITIRRFNEQVMDDPNYAALLDAFGANLLYPSGSRALKRQHDDFNLRINLTHPTQLRAIPHNGILQQLAILANTVGGVGQAIVKDPERFQKVYKASPRLRRLLGMVEWALEFTDLEALKSYVDLFDPGQWLSRAYQAKEPQRAWELRQVAEHLEGEAVYDKLARIYRVFQRDMLDLRDGLAVVGGPKPKLPPEARLNLRLLHGIRIALLMRLFPLATHIPDFSVQHNISREQLISKVIHLEVEDAIRKLATIFPKVEQQKFEGDFGEVATYVGDWNQTYEREHQAIFQPIAGLYALARRVSSGIIHMVGAVG